MGDRTAIQWTDATWNPIVGCSVVSPGCTNCYAMSMARRIEAMQPGTHYAGTTKVVNGNTVWTGKVALAPEHILTQPLRWRRGRKIFVNSMGDLFHESVPNEWIDRVFAVMALCPQHTFQVLTKRSVRMRAYLTVPGVRDRWVEASWPLGEGRPLTPQQYADRSHCGPAGNRISVFSLPLLPNVWLGVSAEDQRRADERVPDLLATPAAVRFVSAEPMLGPINFASLCEQRDADGSIVAWLDALRGLYFGPDQRTTAKLDQIIVGGESGPRARPMHPDWARDPRDQCAAAGTAFFFKQWGEFREFDTGPPPHEEVDDDSDSADAYLAAAEKPSWITPDGRHIRRREDLPEDETPCRLIERVGKRAAGRLLDGQEHNGMPGQGGA